jgi:glycerol-3-phosphate O-acyltransferase
MKNIKHATLLVVGYGLWVAFFTSLVITRYEGHQKVLAEQAQSNQTQLVNNTEKTLQGKVSAAQAEAKSLQTQAISAKQQVSQDNSQACADLKQVQSLLAKNKLSVPVDIPSFCN